MKNTKTHEFLNLKLFRMRIQKEHDLTEEEEERAMEIMIRRRNRVSQEKYSEEIEGNIKILNKRKVFQSTVGAFIVDFAEKINGNRFEYVTRFKIKSRGNLLRSK